MINEDNNQPELEITAGENGEASCSAPEIPLTEPAKEPHPGISAPKRASVLLTDGFLMLALYIVALVIHVLMTQVTTMFNLTPDEYAVTGVAAWANG